MKNTKKLAALSILSALIVILQMLGYILPRLGPFSLSFVLIPIVVGAMLYGVGAGAILGGVFGVLVSICCAVGVDIGGAMVWAANPFLCIVAVVSKGVLAGMASAAVYALAGKGKAGTVLAFAVCPVVNTGVFLLFMRLFFADVLRVWSGGTDIAAYMLTGIVCVNFLPELLINLAFSPAGMRIVRISKKRH